MRGHERIQQYRMDGHKINRLIFLNDFPCLTDWPDEIEHPTVSVAGDRINTLDLRFLVGMAVSVSSEDEQRAKDLFQACINHKAKFVIGNHYKGPRVEDIQSAWFQIWRNK
jgi:hypothetical protein